MTSTSAAAGTRRLILKLSQIRTDGGTQMRESTWTDTVEDYADLLLEGRDFPPVDVFWDGRHYWLAHGFYRYGAHERAGRRCIECVVHDGTQRDAVLLAIASNHENPRHRTNADKQRCVRTMLEDPEWACWTNPRIARQCGVVEKTVREWRIRLLKDARKAAEKTDRADQADRATSELTMLRGQTPAVPAMREERLAEKNGHEYTMRVREPAPLHVSRPDALATARTNCDRQLAAVQDFAESFADCPLLRRVAVNLAKCRRILFPAGDEAAEDVA